MKNYSKFIEQHWKEYSYIDDKSDDDWWFKDKYYKIGIESRKYHYILRDLKPNILNAFNKLSNDIEKIYKLKGISIINGKLLKTHRGSGPTEVKKENDNTEELESIEDKETPEFALEDIFPVDYNEIFDSKLDKDKKLKQKVYNIQFDREIGNTYKRNIYDRYEEIYNNDKTNGNIDKICECILKVSYYAQYNNLKNDNNFIDGGVICNIALMISEYIKTGIINTDIERFKNYSLQELNEEYNTYIIFLLCNIFTCKQKKFKMTYGDEVIRDEWYINLLRRRYSYKIFRTTCILPAFMKDIYGNIILYDGNKEKEENGQDYIQRLKILPKEEYKQYYIPLLKILQKEEYKWKN